MSTPKKTPPAFEQHLQTVRHARAQVDAAVSSLDQALGLADQSILAAWQFLFDHVCKENNPSVSITKLSTASGIIQRLVQSMQKLNSVKSDARSSNQEFARTVLIKSGLPPELRAELEKELQLMG